MLLFSCYTSLKKEVVAKNIKVFEKHSLTEKENKLPDILSTFKSGDLREGKLKKHLNRQGD